jgi:hypothetical protein
MYAINFSLSIIMVVPSWQNVTPRTFLIFHTSTHLSPLPRVVSHLSRADCKAREVKNLIAATLHVVFFEASRTVYPTHDLLTNPLRTNSERVTSRTIGGFGPI